MEDAMPVVRIVEKTMMVFGGSVVPLALLPTDIRTIIEWTPFAATGFPAQVTSPDFVDHAFQLLGIEAVWIVVFGIAVAMLWRRAIRRIEVNGG
jgi:ABC-2 type transport system permease protein